MIVKPTVNELLKNAENRYELVIATSRRAREIAAGDSPLVETDDTSPVTIAANEIVAKKVYIENENKKEEENNEEEKGE